MDKKYALDLLDGKLVAFLDIIGFSKMTIDNQNVTADSKGWICHLSPIYTSIVEKYSQNYQETQGIQFLWVSDSIFIVSSTENDYQFISEVAEIINQMYCTGWSLRGGISMGKVHFEKNIWGPAVSSAVKMEGKAMYPRVIISNHDFCSLPNKDMLLPYFSPSNENEELLEFGFFDFYFQKNIAEGKDLTSYLSVYTGCIAENFSKCEEEEHRKKWGYLSNKLAFSIKKYREYIDNHCPDAKVRHTDRLGISNSKYYLDIIQDPVSHWEANYGQA